MALDKKIFYWAGLGVYALLFFIFITLARLPADKLIAATLGHFTKGRLQLKAERVSYVFPFSYKLKEVLYRLALGEGHAIGRFNSFTIGPDYRRIFMGYVPVQFKGDLPRGNVYGRSGRSILHGMEKGVFFISASDISLEDVKNLKSFSNRDLKGTLKARIDLNGNLKDLSEVNGGGDVLLKNGSIGTRIGIPGMDVVPFENIELAFSIRKGIMELRKGEMKGPMFSGNLSGNIRLQGKISTSQLSLKAKMRPGPLLEKNQLASQFLKKVRKGDEPIHLRIEGALARPSIFWSKD